jgi:lysine-arginine-ornithine-binding protein
MKRTISWMLCVCCVYLLPINTLSAISQPIRFASEATYPPFTFKEKGKMSGFDIEVARALCKQMQVECTFTEIPWEQLLPQLEAGKFDAAIGAVSITKAREQDLLFTEPYYPATASFVAAKKMDLQLDKQGMQGKKIGVQKNTVFFDYLQRTYGDDISVKTYGTDGEALIHLMVKRVDAVLSDTPFMVQWVNRYGRDKYVLVGEPVMDEAHFGKGYGIAVHKDNDELLAALNAALQEIKVSERYKQLQKQYLE